MTTFKERVNEFLDTEGKNTEQLKALLFERSAELLELKAFIKEKGLEAELKERLEQAKAKIDKAI